MKTICEAKIAILSWNFHDTLRLPRHQTGCSAVCPFDLYIPAPSARPGDAPDFSHLVIPPARSSGTRDSGERSVPAVGAWAKCIHGIAMDGVLLLCRVAFVLFVLSPTSSNNNSLC